MRMREQDSEKQPLNWRVKPTEDSNALVARTWNEDGCKNDDGITVLVMFEYEMTAQVLLKFGAKVNEKDTAGYTSL